MRVSVQPPRSQNRTGARARHSSILSPVVFSRCDVPFGLSGPIVPYGGTAARAFPASSSPGSARRPARNDNARRRNGRGFPCRLLEGSGRSRSGGASPPCPLQVFHLVVHVVTVQGGGK